MNQSSRWFIPLWLKLAAGLIVVALIPAIAVTAILLAGSQEVDRQNIISYINQNGLRQRQILTSTFARSTATLLNFSQDTTANRQLTALLLEDVQSNPPLSEGTARQVELLLADVLLDPNTTLYEYVLLLDVDGVVVAAAGNLPLGLTLGISVAETQPYLAITSDTVEEGEINQVMVAYRPQRPTVDIATRVNLRETDTTVGYLVANLDTQQAINNNLSFTGDTFPAYSFLVSRNNIVISLPEIQQEAQASLNTVGVERARDENLDGVDTYHLEGGLGEQVVGYYAPIANTPFVLVTQVPTDAILRQSVAFLSSGGFALGTGMLALIVVLVTFSYFQLITPPLQMLQGAIRGMSLGNFDAPLPPENRNDEIGELSRTFADMREQMRILIDDLEARIAQRSRDVETTQEISRYAASQRDLQILMDRVVHLIVERFPNIYHAQIFLMDSDDTYAILRASTNEPGRQLLERGHRLAKGSTSVIGQVTAQGQIVIARDTATSNVHRQNEFLPDTRAELAIPLRIGDTIIGALDVQSRESATFDDDQVAVLQTMADQLAVAIENARLYQESVQRLREIELSNRNATRRAWQEYMRDRRSGSLESHAGTQTDLDMSPLRYQSLETGQVAVGDLTERQTVPVAVPIRLRGHVIGVVEWELHALDYDRNKALLAQDLADRLAISLDNARLFEQSERAAERERLVNDISAKLTSQTDVNSILQTAVREVGQALRSQQVSIRLNRQSDE